jgi:hypothetical protein
MDKIKINPIIDSAGTKRWRNESNKLDRLNGPAVEWVDGDKVEEWYQNGKRHRLDGPAVTFKNGEKQWWVNGLIHREDGPAVVFPEGINQWWIKNAVYRTKEDYFNALSEKAKAKCLFSEDFLNG